MCLVGTVVSYTKCSRFESCYCNDKYFFVTEIAEFGEIFRKNYVFLFFSRLLMAIAERVTSWPNDTVKTAFGIGLMFVQFFIPVLVLIICYGQIIWVLTRRINTDLIKNKSAVDNSDNVNETTDNAVTHTKAVDPGKEKFQLARRNTIKTLLIAGLCFIICWSQDQIMYFMYNFGYNINLNTVYSEFTILMVFLNCTVNPFINLIQYRDYQETLKQFFYCNKNQGMSNRLNLSTMSISQTSRPTQA